MYYTPPNITSTPVQRFNHVTPLPPDQIAAADELRCIRFADVLGECFDFDMRVQLPEPFTREIDSPPAKTGGVHQELPVQVVEPQFAAMSEN